MKRIAAFVLSLLMLTPPLLPLMARASSVEDYREVLGALSSEYKALENKQKSIQNEINKAVSEKAKEQAKKKNVDMQVQTTTQQINLLNQQIELLSRNIAEKEQEIAEKQREIDKNYIQLKERFKAMYMSGDESVLGLLLGVESFFDFLTRAEVASRVAARDREVVAWVGTELIALEDAKAEIEQNKQDVEKHNQTLAVKGRFVGSVRSAG